MISSKILIILLIILIFFIIMLSFPGIIILFIIIYVLSSKQIKDLKLFTKKNLNDDISKLLYNKNNIHTKGMIFFNLINKLQNLQKNLQEKQKISINKLNSNQNVVEKKSTFNKKIKKDYSNVKFSYAGKFDNIEERFKKKASIKK